MSEEMRVGDRYVRGEDKITITAVDGTTADYTVLAENGTSWSSRCSVPPPKDWRKAGSGPPEPTPLCMYCEVEEVEPGMLFCLECADIVVAQWAGLPFGEIADRVAALKVARAIDERDDEERERGRA
jgi:hypothetical protein